MSVVQLHEDSKIQQKLQDVIYNTIWEFSENHIVTYIEVMGALEAVKQDIYAVAPKRGDD